MINSASKKVFIFLFFLVGFVIAIYLYMGHFQYIFVLDTLVKKERKIASDIYKNTFENINQKYTLIGKNILINEAVIHAFQSGNRKELFRLSDPIFQELKKDNPYLTLMHFHTKDTHSFLRMHRPQKYGDNLQSIRFLINKVNQTKQIQIGFEVGRYGIFYRIAFPVFDSKKEHIGAMEFGIDIEYILNLFNKQYEFASTLLIKKELFEIIYEFKKDDRFKKISSNYVMLQCEKESCKRFCKDHAIDPKVIKKSYYFDSHEGIDWLIYRMKPLVNIYGEEIGHIIFKSDLNYYTDTISVMRVIAITLAAVLLMLTFYLLRRVFFGYSTRINIYQNTLEQKNRALKKLNNIDYLTNAYNRRFIDKVMISEMHKAARYKTPLSIILFDVDNFKHINDHFGHALGDTALRSIAQLVSGSIRESDYFGRWGGEEFIIIVPQLEAEKAVSFADKLRGMIESHDFETLGTVTCSFGVAQWHEDETIEQTMQNADNAMYIAKKSGKNRVIQYQESL